MDFHMQYDQSHFDFVHEYIVKIPMYPQHACYYLSCAIDSMMGRGIGGSVVISSDQAERMVDSLSVIRDRSDSLYDGALPHQDVLDGIRILIAATYLWAETSEERKSHPSDAVADLRAEARIFQNKLHNASLLAEIRERREKSQKRLAGEFIHWHSRAAIFDEAS